MSLAFITAASIVFLLRSEPEKQLRVREVAPTQVAVYTVQPRDLSPLERVSGRLQPSQRAQLRFELSGHVQERLVEPGQNVRAGQALLQLSDGDYRDALVEAQAQLALERETVRRDRELMALARRNRELQAKELQRFERLSKKSLVAASKVDEVRQRLAQLESEEAQLRFSVQSADERLKLRAIAVDRARRNLERTRLVAPFDGTVNSVQIQAGDYVSPSQPALELIATDRLDLHMDVRGELAAAQRLGDKVTVRVGGGEAQGEVVALQKNPNSTTFTYAMSVRLPAGTGLPGMLAEAQLSMPALNRVVSVPASAVVHENGAAYVLSVDDSSVLQRQYVALGPRVGEWQVIRSGLQAGEAVVRSNVMALSPGQRVMAGTAERVALEADGADEPGANGLRPRVN